MEGAPLRDPLHLRAVLGAAVLTVLLLAVLGLQLASSAVDPQGMSLQGPLTPADAPRWEPLYAVSWTPFGSLDWSPDGRLIAVGGDLVPGVSLLDARTGLTVRVIAVPDAVDVVRWSPDGQRLAVGTGSVLGGAGSVYVYEASGFLDRSWQAHSAYVGGLAWSPNGSWLVTTTNGRYAIWNGATGALVRRDVNASSIGDNVDWSPDGTRIAFEANGGPAVYDVASGNRLWYTYPGGWDERSVAWSHDGTSIASANSDGCLAVYTPDGQYLWGYNVSYESLGAPSSCDAVWSRRPSWNPADSLIAVPTTAGLRVFDARAHTLLRNLDFPWPPSPGNNYGAVYGSGDSQDIDAEWSPAGNVLASSASVSASSVRLWGIPHRSSAAYGALFNGVLVVGIPASLGSAFTDLLLRPGPAFVALSRKRPTFAPGLALLVFLFVAGGIQQTEWSVESLIQGAQVVPPGSWFAANLILSLVLAVVPVVLAVLAFRTVLWRGPPASRTARTRAAASSLGWSLAAFVWTYSVGLVIVDAVTALTGSADPVSATLLLGAAGGLGFLVAVFALASLPGSGPGRAAAGLVGAAATSLAASFLLFLGLVLLLRLAPGLATGDLAVYGVAIGFGFGLVPWIAVVALFVTLAGGYALAIAPPKALLSLFARLRHPEVASQRTRREVLVFLKDHPGTHFRALLRALPIGSGSLHYHLFVLEREGFVVARRDGMYRRFFPSAEGLRDVVGGVDASPKDA